MMTTLLQFKEHYLCNMKRLRIRALLLIPLLAGGFVSQASAQTPTTFVQNFSESGGFDNFNARYATSFTTGSNVFGYTLSSVYIGFHRNTGSGTVVAIRENNGSGEPGGLFVTLNNPSTFNTGGRHQFTAPVDTTLSANTTYWVVVNDSGGSTIRMSRTTADGETGESGWSISDHGLSGSLNNWTRSDSKNYLIVEGFVKTAPGVTITRLPLSLTELHATSGTGSYSVVLDTDPGTGKTVTVTPTSDDTTSVTFPPTTLTFTGGSSGNWAIPQEVTVTAVNDADAVSETVTISHVTTSPDTSNDYYNFTTDSVTVNVTDAGHGILVTPTSLRVGDNDGEVTYTVRLFSAPAGPVSVHAASGTPATATVTPASHSFNSDWATPKTFTVTGKVIGQTTITNQVTGGSDSNYPSGTAGSDVSVTVNDGIAPSVVSINRQTPSEENTNANTLIWQVVFSEAVTNVDAMDFELAGTTADLAVVAESGSATTYNVTASGGDLAGLTATVTLSFAASQSIEDSSGTVLTATTPVVNNNSFKVDNTGPTLSITLPANSSAPFITTFTFSEEVNGFTVDDITVTNGSPGALTETTPKRIWTALISPNLEGAVTVSVGANTVTDLAGNSNPTATEASSTYDIAPTVISIVRQDPKSGTTNADRLSWRVTFSETVKGVQSGDFLLAGTTARINQISGFVDRSFTAKEIDVIVSNSRDLTNANGRVTLSFASGHNIQNLNGTVMTDTTPRDTNEDSFYMDNVAPTVVISGVPLASTIPFEATFTFSEAMPGFKLADIVVVNGVASELSGSGMIYTARITPTTNGEVTVDVMSTDPAGNSNPSAKVSSTYDAAPQVASIVRLTPNRKRTNADSLTWRVIFNERVIGVDVKDFELTGTTADLAVSGTGSEYDVTATGGDLADLNGSVTLSFSSDLSIEDGIGTALTHVSLMDTNSFEVDNIGPALSIDLPANSSAAFTATFNFAEAVTGFELNDIDVVNGVASGLTGSGMTYTARITPIAEGKVTVNVAANVAEDDIGNGNFAAPQASSTYTAPALILTPREVAVSEGTRNTYRVTLATPPTGNVTVTVSGASGEVTVDTDPGRSGDQNTLSFTSSDWNIGKAVTVSAGRDDDLVNDRATLVHRATGADYGSVTGELVVTVIDTNSLVSVQTAFLPRFGRILGQQSVDAVTDRLKAGRSAGLSGQFAGQALPELSGERFSPMPSADSLSDGSGDLPEGHGTFFAGVETGAIGSTGNRVSESTQLTDNEIVSGTSFAFTTGEAAGDSLSFWGRGAYSGFESGENGLKLDSEVTSFMLGADWKRNRHLFGLMVSQSRGNGDYRLPGGEGEIETDLTALIPYLGWEVNDRISGWVSLGFGQGELTFLPGGGTALTTDMDWQMAAGGSSGALGFGFLGGAKLSWNTDILWTRTASEAGDGLSSGQGDTTRLRVGIESRWTRRFASGGQLSPHLELGHRYDGGDAETGYGLEIGGGLDWSDPVRGLEIGLEGRTLALHEDEGIEDWGLAFSVVYDPYPQTKRGLNALVSHDFGGVASGGVASLLHSDLFPEAARSDGSVAWSAEMAYGLRRSGGMVGSPYTRLSGDRTGFERMRLGYRIEPDALDADDMTLDLWAEPEIEANRKNGAVAGIELRKPW